MLKQLLPIFFVSCILITKGYAQELPASLKQTIDSLKYVSVHAKEDTTKISSILEIGNHYLNINSDSSLFYFKKAEKMSLKAKFQEGIADCYSFYGILAQIDGDFVKSLEYFRKALNIGKKIKDQTIISSNLCNIGTVYYYQGDHMTALDYFYESLKITEKLGDEERTIDNLLNIASVLRNQQELEKAIETQKKCLRLAHKMQSDNHIASSTERLGTSYRFKMNREMKLNAPLDSIHFYKKLSEECYNNAIEIWKKLGQDKQIGSVNQSKGLIHKFYADYLSRKNFPEDSVSSHYNKALSYFKTSREIHEKMVHRTALISNTQFIAEIYLAQNNVNEALSMANENLKITEVYGDKILLKQSYELLYKIYKKLKKYDLALEMYEKSMEVSLQMTNENSEKETLRKEFVYENAKREQKELQLTQHNEVNELQLKNNQYLLIGIVLLSLLIITVFMLIIRNNKIKAREKNLRLQQKLLLSRMNPHFMFNALSSIQNYMYANDSNKAGDFLSSFARLSRGILDHSQVEAIPLEKELQWLNDYIKLQQLRFENEVEFTLHIDDNIDLFSTFIPPMLVQPFVENTFEHGFRNINHKGILSIDYKRKNNTIIIQIQDNGIGFSQNTVEEQVNSHVSQAIKITRERLTLLNKGKSNKIQIDVDSKPDEGTTISFTIPLITLK